MPFQRHVPVTRKLVAMDSIASSRRPSWRSCRSPCPWYLRDSPPSMGTGLAPSVRRILRAAALQTACCVCSTEPERVWEFAPSVRLGTVVPACSPAGAILCGLRSQLQSYWGYHLLPVCGVAGSGYSL